jgi:hypothetical protein
MLKKEGFPPFFVGFYMKAVLSALLIVPPLLLFHFQPLPSYPTEFLSAGLLVIITTSVVVFRSEPIAFPKVGIAWILLGCIWLIVTFTSDAALEVKERRLFFVWIIGCLALLARSIFGRSRGGQERISFFAICILLMAFLQSVIGFLNHYGVLGAYVSWLNYAGSRFSGTVAQPNMAAFSLFLGIASSLYLYLANRISSSLFFGVFSALLYFSFITYSRSFYLYLVILLFFFGVYAFFNKEGVKYRWFSAFLVLVPVLVFSVAKPIDEKISYFFNEYYGLEDKYDPSERLNQFSDSARLCEWSKSYDALVNNDFSLFGNGIGSYSIFSSEYTSEANLSCSLDKRWSHSHNILINSVVEWGWLGFLAVALSWVFALIMILKASRGKERFYGLSLFSAFFVYSLIEFPLWNIYLLVVFLIFLSLYSPVWMVRFPSRDVFKGLSILFLALMMWVGGSSFNVYLKVSEIFNAESPSERQLRWLYLYGSDSMYGDVVTLTRYYKFLPEPHSYEEQLMEVNALLDVEAHPILLVRKGLLHFLNKDGDEFCRVYDLLEYQYPRFFAQLNSDLNSVKNISAFRVSDTLPCG